jgi:serine/threonine protein kinase
LKILDLGLALLNEANRAISQNLTSTGQIMVTLDYMAPEQADDTHAVDIRADIYSLGCTLYALLAGEPPYGGPQYTTAVKKLAGHMSKPVPRIRDRRADVPQELVALLDCMLAKRAEDRPSTPAAVAAALEPLASGHDLASLLKRAQQSRPAKQPASGSIHETQGQASSALTATRPAQPSGDLALTIDHLAATDTLAGSSPPVRGFTRRRMITAVAVVLLAVIIMVSVNVAVTLRRDEPSPPTVNLVATLATSSDSTATGGAR